MTVLRPRARPGRSRLRTTRFLAPPRARITRRRRLAAMAAMPPLFLVSTMKSRRAATPRPALTASAQTRPDTAMALAVRVRLDLAALRPALVGLRPPRAGATLLRRPPVLALLMSVTLAVLGSRHGTRCGLRGVRSRRPLPHRAPGLLPWLLRRALRGSSRTFTSRSTRSWAALGIPRKTTALTSRFGRCCSKTLLSSTSIGSPRSTQRNVRLPTWRASLLPLLGCRRSAPASGRSITLRCVGTRGYAICSCSSMPRTFHRMAPSPSLPTSRPTRGRRETPCLTSRSS